MIGLAGVDVGLEQGELAGLVGAAALHPITAQLVGGIDARARIDLERDADDPMDEPSWEITAGPLASYALGRFAITAAAGVSASELRLTGPREVGLFGGLGAGAVF